MSVELEEKSATEWMCNDGQGRLEYIDKNILQVDHTYQRNPVKAKVDILTRKWEWRHCGVLVVAERVDGSLWVIDGQHRLSAAKRRREIDTMPCVVFRSLGQQAEASEFLGANVNRKPLTAIERHKAAVVALIPESQAVQRLCDELGLRLASCTHSATDIKCIGVLTQLVQEHGEQFAREVLHLGIRSCREDNVQVEGRFLRAMMWLCNNLSVPITDKRLGDRIEDVGAKRLSKAMNLHVEMYGKSGDKVYALGILQELNKGLRNKFTLKGDAT